MACPPIIEQGPQPFQRAKLAHFWSAFGKAQHGGHVARRHLLEVEARANRGRAASWAKVACTRAVTSRRGQGTVAQILGQPSIRLSQRLLHHIGRIDSRGWPTVQTQSNRLPQPRPVSGEEPVTGLSLALTGPLKQLLRVGIVRIGHASPLRWTPQSPAKGHAGKDYFAPAPSGQPAPRGTERRILESPAATDARTAL
jgi:hypothetical protein